MYVEIRGQPSGVDYLLLPRRFGTENEVGTLDNKHLCFLQPSSGTLMDTVAGYKNLRLFSVDFTLQILRLGETNQMFFIVGMIKMLFYD